MRVALLGLGLIGGSIARALHADTRGGWSVAAWTPTGVAPRVAEDAGIIELAAGTPAAAIDGADLVVLAASPLDCLDHLRALGGPLREALSPGAVITDVASTKAAIVAAGGARRACGSSAATRWPGGRRAGSTPPTSTLFRGRPWVIVEPARAGDADARDRVEALATRLRRAGRADDGRRARPRSWPRSATCRWCCRRRSSRPSPGPVGDPRPDWPAAEALAAGGWASMTRLARGDVEMGAGIAATNAAEIAARLRDVRAVIDGWLADLDARGRCGHGRDPPAAGVRARHGRGRGLSVGDAGERVLVVPREADRPGARAGPASAGKAWSRRSRPWRARACSWIGRSPRRTAPTSRSSRTSSCATASAGS